MVSLFFCQGCRQSEAEVFFLDIDILGGDSGNAVFRYENQMRKPIVIKSLAPSCSCLKVWCDNLEIPPRGSVDINIQISLLPDQKQRAANVIIESSSSNYDLIRVTGRRRERYSFIGSEVILLEGKASVYVHSVAQADYSLYCTQGFKVRKVETRPYGRESIEKWQVDIPEKSAEVTDWLNLSIIEKKQETRSKLFRLKSGIKVEHGFFFLPDSGRIYIQAFSSKHPSSVNLVGGYRCNKLEWTRDIADGSILIQADLEGEGDQIMYLMIDGDQFPISIMDSSI